MQPDPVAGAPGGLAPLEEINDLALELMSLRAAEEPAGLPAILREPVDLWRALSPPRRRRLAGCPFLLVDIGFDATGAAPRGALEGVREPQEPALWFAGEALPRLSYLTLTYAWHLARTRRLAARVVLGLPDDSADWLAALTLRQLGECLECSPRFLRPRWAGSPAVWQHLLAAATSEEPADFELARLRGIQLLAATYWPAESGPRRRPW
ncbi:MAG: hypothetical protein AB7G76_02085 [Steroidobacteraceae bacterium]